MTGMASWFKKRPLWVQDAARRLIQNPGLKPSDLDELVGLCKDEATGVAKPDSRPKAGPIPEHLFRQVDRQTPVRLNAIEDVTGINALAPRQPLEFGSEPLVIIYGPNASGKSGYMRLMKHVCGARAAGHLYGDVFAASLQNQSCTIRYTLGTKEHRAEWTPAKGMVADLQSCSIYDTGCAHMYIDDEHEVTYEPPVLGLLRRLVDVCDEVGQLLQREVASKPSTLPKWPGEYAHTDSQSWYERVSSSTPSQVIEERCAWSDHDDATLTSLNQRLAETDPAAKAKTLRGTKTHLAKLVTLMETIEGQVSDDAFSVFLKAKQEAETKRRATSEGAERVFSAAPLKGVSSESWRLLWEQARVFSEQAAYPAMAFPNTGDEARCVLCQQLLADDAKNRLQRFEEFVKGNLERDAAEAEKSCQELVQSRVEIPNEEELEVSLDLAGVADETIRELIRSGFATIRSRQEQFSIADDADTLPTLPVQTAADYLVELETKLESQASAFEEDAQSSDRDQVRKQKRELEARKWLCAQGASIKAEVERQKGIQLLEKARRLTNTKALSHKASILSEGLVTQAFKKRFEDELTLLGASTFRVRLEKVKASKGQVWHRLKLHKAHQPAPTRDILSEGEFRIVSIAAFLADVAADGGSTAFIFDDPVSSLDQLFEEKVAQRLVTLATSRQVVVLTHRLAFLSSLEEARRKAGIPSRVIAVERRPWGTGEPGEAPLPAQKPSAALNTLLNQRLPKAKVAYEESGSSEYSALAKDLCSNIRICIERLVEYDLLADVIQRFRRPIHTEGKLHRIAKVTAEDCRFLDSMMTKYSRHEHSQPEEAPVALPEPDELHHDLTRLIEWQSEFSKREHPQL